MVVSKALSTPDAPRAHSFNPFAFGSYLHTKQVPLLDSTNLWAQSVCDIGLKMQPWSGQRAVNITPCEFVDLTQLPLEPLLAQYASHHNFSVHFSTELFAFQQVAGGNNIPEFICTLHDNTSRTTFNVRIPFRCRRGTQPHSPLA